MSHRPFALPLSPAYGYELHAKLVDRYDREHLVHLDAALPKGKKAPNAWFYLCGPGDEEHGYRLSGPQGLALQLARQHHPGKSPRDLGLSAWIAARYTHGDRLVLAPDLELILS